MRETVDRGRKGKEKNHHTTGGLCPPGKEEREEVSPSELNWPVCPKKGFKVNPKRACAKCKKKGKLKFQEYTKKWFCFYVAL
jgi:hypothetical protein